MPTKTRKRVDGDTPGGAGQAASAAAPAPAAKNPSHHRNAAGAGAGVAGGGASAGPSSQPPPAARSRPPRAPSAGQDGPAAAAAKPAPLTADALVGDVVGEAGEQIRLCSGILHADVRSTSRLVHAVRKTITEVYYPMLVAKMDCRGGRVDAGRVKLSALLAIRDLLLINGSGLFAFDGVRGGRGLDGASSRFLVRIFAETIVRNTAKRLGLHGHGRMLEGYEAAASDMEGGTGEMAASSGPADVRTEMGRGLGARRSVLERASYNLALRRQRQSRGAPEANACVFFEIPPGVEVPPYAPPPRPRPGKAGRSPADASPSKPSKSKAARKKGADSAGKKRTSKQKNSSAEAAAVPNPLGGTKPDPPPAPAPSSDPTKKHARSPPKKRTRDRQGRKVPPASKARSANKHRANGSGSSSLIARKARLLAAEAAAEKSRNAAAAAGAAAPHETKEAPPPPGAPSSGGGGTAPSPPDAAATDGRDPAGAAEGKGRRTAPGDEGENGADASPDAGPRGGADGGGDGGTARAPGQSPAAGNGAVVVKI